ncbi:hypothetical protein EDD11_010190 [Mortierella claussenii]|nr:hypothetical protein EDD11_010190 [Mortierella claussenii]
MATLDNSLYLQRTPQPPATATLPLQTGSRPPSRFTTPASSPFSGATLSFSPDKTFLPRSTLRNAAGCTANLEKLFVFRECFQKREFWEEYAILERMHYKNKSQHRQSSYFQRLCECRRLTARIKELDIAGLVDELLKKFYSGKSIKAILGAKDQWDSIPYRSTMAFTMTRIIGAILLLRKLQAALHETYGAFYQLMSKTQFMSFALIAIGLCSRLSVTSKAWTSELMDCYELLERWIKSLPKEEELLGAVDYESRLPTSIQSVILDCVPEVPETPLPLAPTQLQKDQPSSQGQDLGEVIQRSELSSTPTSSSVRPSPRHVSRSNPESERMDRDIDTKVDSGNDRHHDLLGELDTIFSVKAPSLSQSIIPKKTNVLSNLSDLDEIFMSEKKQKHKDKKRQLKQNSSNAVSSAPSSTRSSPGPITKTKVKSSAGSTTNFDSIFSFERAPSAPTTPIAGSSAERGGKGTAGMGALSKKAAKDKQEIDDIFGSISKTKKKPSFSEIDSIFGTPAKKKKKKAM